MKKLYLLFIVIFFLISNLLIGQNLTLLPDSQKLLLPPDQVNSQQNQYWYAGGCCIDNVNGTIVAEFNRLSINIFNHTEIEPINITTSMSQKLIIDVVPEASWLNTITSPQHPLNVSFDLQDDPTNVSISQVLKLDSVQSINTPKEDNQISLCYYNITNAIYGFIPESVGTTTLHFLITYEDGSTKKITANVTTTP